MSKFLVNLFMLKTRLIVNTYTVTTLPLYYMIQKPWKQLELAEKIRSKKFNTTNGELVWKRNEPPISHPFLECKSYAEVLTILESTYGPNRVMIGHRDVINERVEKDENGNVIQMDGKILRKFILSDSYKWLTLSEVLNRVDNIAKGLVKSGVKKGDKVRIWADTRLEWLLCSLALMKINAILTTLFSNLGISGLIHGLNQTEAKTIITTFDLLPKLKSFIKDVPNIESIVYIKNKNENNVSEKKFAPNATIQSLDQLEALGEREANMKFELPNGDDVGIIMYTSGTTGQPKAVCISHKALITSLRTLLSNAHDLAHEAERHVYVSYLPLAHIFGFTFEMFLFLGGVRIGYSSPFTLTDSSPGLFKGQKSDVRLLHPTAITTVPLVLDRILKEIYAKLNSRTPISAPLFTYLMDYKTYWKTKGYDTPIINKLFCEKVRQALGGKLEYIVVGGAPLNQRTQALIKAALNVKLTQGYGATETCGGILGMHFEDNTYGRIGIPLDGVTVKLVDWTEGGYCVTDKPNPRGELVIGSDIIAQGYYKLTDETEDAFDVDSEGQRWFYTGDIGEVFPNGSFRIIDRKKDLAKLPNGEYISLGKIETALKSCPFVENICVTCSTNANHINALICPDNKLLFKLAKQLGKPDTCTREELCNDVDIYNKVYECIVESAKTHQLHKIEIPLKVKLCAEEWTQENDLITAALKLKRNKVMEYYKEDIEKLFDSNNS